MSRDQASVAFVRPTSDKQMVLRFDSISAVFEVVLWFSRRWKARAFVFRGDSARIMRGFARRTAVGQSVLFLGPSSRHRVMAPMRLSSEYCSALIRVISGRATYDGQ